MAIHHKQRQLDLIAPLAIDELQRVVAAIQSALEVNQRARSDFFKSGLEHITDDLRTAEFNLECACFDSEETIRLFSNPVRARVGLRVVSGETKDE